MAQGAVNIPEKDSNYSKFLGYVKLTKVRLSALVVFSALITYLTIAAPFNWHTLLVLAIGGFLVTGSANGFNQIIERDLDKKMNRTMNRPLPLNIISSTPALIFCIIIGIIGTFLLGYFINPLSGLIGFLSILLYTLFYTPLKRKTPLSVFVGAFPGALPTLIGGIAATEGFGSVSFFTILLFIIQFVWQFPHFWSLAWFNSEDYAKADFFLLPSAGGKDDSTKFQILLYSVVLLIVSIFPFVFGFTGIISACVCVLAGLALVLQAYNFYRIGSDVLAKKLFFITLIYLPVIQIALMTKQ
ncbi:MAG: protoheme IX farnesyltransferase [Sphingobacteriaceae bacterium]|nr:protoheme IX farnesyltransferase [Sphingobacteriaceae bacterium]